MLYTNLNHLETPTWYEDHVQASENVLLVCGSMSPNSVKLYRLLEDLKESYTQVLFYDMECDNPNLNIWDYLPQDHANEDSPIVVFYKKGRVLEVKKNHINKKGMSELLEKLISAEN